MPAFKLFADKLTDLEDELQRMRELLGNSTDREAAETVTRASDALIELARVVMVREGSLPLAETY